MNNQKEPDSQEINIYYNPAYVSYSAGSSPDIPA